MDRIQRYGLYGLILAVALTGKPGLAAQSELHSSQLVLFSRHGIQFAWNEMRVVKAKRMASGECSWASVRQITHEPNNCVLSVELARDTSSCTSLVQRGTPLNTARCTTPITSGSVAATEWHPVIDMNSGPAMAASLFTLVLVPAYFELLGQSHASPGNNNTDMALNVPSFLTPGNAPEVADLQ